MGAFDNKRERVSMFLGINKFTVKVYYFYWLNPKVIKERKEILVAKNALHYEQWANHSFDGHSTRKLFIT